MFNYQERIAKLQQLAVAQQIDYVFIAPGANLLYFTGLNMHMSERPTMVVVPAVGEAFAYCPAFESSKIKKVTGIENYITYVDEEGPYETVKRWAAQNSIAADSVVAFEYRAARLLEYDVIRQALPDCHLLDARSIMAEMRMCKDEKELKYLQYAADLSDKMMQGMRDILKAGVKESQLREAGLAVLQDEAPNCLSFMSVASGPKASDPHSTSEDRVINEGELVIIDMGARWNGYSSDITRTLPVGRISDELNKIYEIVRRANQAGRAAAKPGITCQELDRITRKVIEDAGYGLYFTHRTGHGLGLEVHEEPYIVDGNEVVLLEGMVFTIEPGIYIPGVGGVRIEDDVVITADGCYSLTNYPRELC